LDISSLESGVYIETGKLFCFIFEGMKCLLVVPLFFLMFFGSMDVHASDTLKVRKIRFFAEPKAAFFIPTPTHNKDTGSFSNVDGYGGHNFNVHNITSINFGISSGLSVRLSKYFRYEFSLVYNHYNMSIKESGTYYETINGAGPYLITRSGI
jgi:hypothetical protein